MQFSPEYPALYQVREVSVSADDDELDGDELLALARKETGLPIITEVMSTEDVDLVEGYADILLGLGGVMSSVRTKNQFLRHGPGAPLFSPR